MLQNGQIKNDARINRLYQFWGRKNTFTVNRQLSSVVRRSQDHVHITTCFVCHDTLCFIWAFRLYNNSVIIISAGIPNTTLLLSILYRPRIRLGLPLIFGCYQGGVGIAEKYTGYHRKFRTVEDPPSLLIRKLIPRDHQIKLISGVYSVYSRHKPSFEACEYQYQHIEHETNVRAVRS